MNFSDTDGILGAVVFVAIIIALYFFATKKSPWNVTSPIPDDWKKGKSLLVVAGIALLFLAIWLLPSLQAPTPKDVWEWTKNYWLWVILILGIPFFLLYIVKERWAKALQGFLAVVAMMFFVVIPLVHGIWGEKSSSQQVQQQQIIPQGCTSASPCTPVVGTDGSTEIVHIKEGDSVCFEPYFWKNINKLGIKVSYKGGPETGYGSTGDSFRFIPETGLTPPRYWFVPEGSSKC